MPALKIKEIGKKMNSTTIIFRVSFFGFFYGEIQRCEQALHRLLLNENVRISLVVLFCSATEYGWIWFLENDVDVDDIKLLL